MSDNRRTFHLRMSVACHVAAGISFVAVISGAVLRLGGALVPMPLLGLLIGLLLLFVHGSISNYHQSQRFPPQNTPSE